MRSLKIFFAGICTLARKITSFLQSENIKQYCALYLGLELGLRLELELELELGVALG